jgi:hypothetical protein
LAEGVRLVLQLHLLLAFLKEFKQVLDVQVRRHHRALQHKVGGLPSWWQAYMWIIFIDGKFEKAEIGERDRDWAVLLRLKANSLVNIIKYNKSFGIIHHLSQHTHESGNNNVRNVKEAMGWIIVKH